MVGEPTADRGGAPNGAGDGTVLGVSPTPEGTMVPMLEDAMLPIPDRSMLPMPDELMVPMPDVAMAPIPDTVPPPQITPDAVEEEWLDEPGYQAAPPAHRRARPNPA